jgi:hypothetical protein
VVLDSIDEALVLRANRILWPVVTSVRNLPGKENSKPPGRFLVRPDWGETYINLLDFFLDIENVAPLGNLPTALQPHEVKQWKKRHRVCSLRNDLDTDGRRLPDQLAAWWVSIQPAERILPNGSLSNSIPNGLDWTSLRLGGPNGLVLVVAGLALWRAALDTGKLSGTVARWDTLVSDVRNVFAAISIVSPVPPMSPPGTQPPRKRARVNPPASSSQSRPPKKLRT